MMAPIRLAHVIYDLGFAGKEQGIIKVVNQMDPERFKVDVIVLNRIDENALSPDLNFDIVPLQKERANDPKLIFRLAALFRQKQYDIVYTHSWNTLLEGYLGAKIAGVPIRVHGEHGTFEHSKVKNVLQPRVWARFDAITVVADALRQKMIQEFQYKHPNVVVIHNGVDRSRFFPSDDYRADCRKRLSLNDEFVIGTVGRLHPVKDHFTLIRGFAQFSQKVPKARLVIVGKETQRGVYQQCLDLIHDLQISDRVLFVPPSRQVEKLYNGFDVFCLSSISEGCSNVILEAMACGVPVVATRTGGTPELVEHGKTGLLFEVHDAAGLASHLERLHQDGAFRLALQKNGLQSIAERFSLKRTVEKYEQLYETLLPRKSSKKRRMWKAASARFEYGS